MNPDLEYSAFEAIVHETYFPRDDHRGSGKASGQLWRFIREMEPGSMVLIPHYQFFNIVEITGDVTYSPFTEHWAYRRTAAWWSRPSSVFRRSASAALQVRARTLITCIEATDLLPDILAMVPGAVPTYDR
jgi:predicted Mrr-cat superfamily restriction endonuclease